MCAGTLNRSGGIIRSRLADWSLRHPCYNVYITDKERTTDHWLYYSLIKSIQQCSVSLITRDNKIVIITN